MGIELESDKGGEDNKNAKTLLYMANLHDEHINCECRLDTGEQVDNILQFV